MANRSMEIVTGLPMPPSSVTPPSRWWTQLHSLFLRRKELTKEEKSAIFCKPYLCGFLTIVTFMGIFLFMNKLFCHVSFSVESIYVSPSSSAALHFDFLARNPSSFCPINYDGDDVYAKLGSINAACDKRVFELDMKLSAKKKHPGVGNEYGHFYIRCHNLTIGYQKTKCHSSFKELDHKSIYDILN
ncbi:PREDICTED: uncharacterized protein LOC104772437 [Camelina sativa]|uniref:Uncharacterized protein LOC104772437 n=1 Tax=Camelina sativa TaxID=90675 RepID=A0ABM0Y4J2_CAMSA|nr:PREDICTED: uncharacterized protein LOC104772437 [Camelina sativa]